MFNGFKDPTNCYSNQPLFENCNQPAFLPCEGSKQTSAPPWDYTTQNYNSAPFYSGDQHMNHRLAPPLIPSTPVLTQFDRKDSSVTINNNFPYPNQNQTLVRPTALINCQSSGNACCNHPSRIPHWNSAESARYLGNSSGTLSKEVSRFPQNVSTFLHDDARFRSADSFVSSLNNLSKFSRDTSVNNPSVTSNAAKKTLASSVENCTLRQQCSTTTGNSETAEKYSKNGKSAKKNSCSSCPNECRPSCRLYDHQAITEFSNLETNLPHTINASRENVVRHTGHTSSNNGTATQVYSQWPSSDTSQADIWLQNSHASTWVHPESVRMSGNGPPHGFWMERNGNMPHPQAYQDIAQYKSQARDHQETSRYQNASEKKKIQEFARYEAHRKNIEISRYQESLRKKSEVCEESQLKGQDAYGRNQDIVRYQELGASRSNSLQVTKHHDSKGKELSSRYHKVSRTSEIPDPSKHIGAIVSHTSVVPTYALGQELSNTFQPNEVERRCLDLMPGSTHNSRAETTNFVPFSRNKMENYTTGIAQPPSRFSSSIYYTQSKISRSNHDFLVPQACNDSFNAGGTTLPTPFSDLLGSNLASLPCKLTTTNSTPINMSRRNHIHYSNCKGTIDFTSAQSDKTTSDVIRYGVSKGSTDIGLYNMPGLQSCNKMSDNTVYGKTMQVVDDQDFNGHKQSNSYNSSKPQNHSINTPSCREIITNPYHNVPVRNGNVNYNTFCDTTTMQSNQTSLPHAPYDNMLPLGPSVKGQGLMHPATTSESSVFALSNSCTGEFSSHPLGEDSTSRPIKKRKSRFKDVSKQERYNVSQHLKRWHRSNQHSTEPVLDVRQFLETWDEESEDMSASPKVSDVELTNNNAPLFVLDCRDAETSGLSTLHGNSDPEMVQMYQHLHQVHNRGQVNVSVERMPVQECQPLQKTSVSASSGVITEVESQQLKNTVKIVEELVQNNNEILSSPNNAFQAGPSLSVSSSSIENTSRDVHNHPPPKDVKENIARLKQEHNATRNRSTLKESDIETVQDTAFEELKQEDMNSSVLRNSGLIEEPGPSMPDILNSPLSSQFVQRHSVDTADNMLALPNATPIKNTESSIEEPVDVKMKNNSEQKLNRLTKEETSQEQNGKIQNTQDGPSVSTHESMRTDKSKPSIKSSHKKCQLLQELSESRTSIPKTVIVSTCQVQQFSSNTNMDNHKDLSLKEKELQQEDIESESSLSKESEQLKTSSDDHFDSMNNTLNCEKDCSISDDEFQQLTKVVVNDQEALMHIDSTGCSTEVKVLSKEERDTESCNNSPVHHQSKQIFNSRSTTPDIMSYASTPESLTIHDYQQINETCTTALEEDDPSLTTESIVTGEENKAQTNSDQGSIMIHNQIESYTRINMEMEWDHVSDKKKYAADTASDDDDCQLTEELIEKKTASENRTHSICRDSNVSSNNVMQLNNRSVQESDPSCQQLQHASKLSADAAVESLQVSHCTENVTSTGEVILPSFQPINNSMITQKSLQMNNNHSVIEHLQDEKDEPNISAPLDLTMEIEQSVEEFPETEVSILPANRSSRLLKMKSVEAHILSPSEIHLQRREITPDKTYLQSPEVLKDKKIISKNNNDNALQDHQSQTCNYNKEGQQFVTQDTLSGQDSKERSEECSVEVSHDTDDDENFHLELPCTPTDQQKKEEDDCSKEQSTEVKLQHSPSGLPRKAESVSESSSVTSECEKPILPDDLEDKSKAIAVFEPVKETTSVTSKCEQTTSWGNLIGESDEAVNNVVLNKENTSLTIKHARAIHQNDLKDVLETVKVVETVSRKITSSTSECEKTMDQGHLEDESDVNVSEPNKQSVEVSECERTVNQINLEEESENVKVSVPIKDDITPVAECEEVAHHSVLKDGAGVIVLPESVEECQSVASECKRIIHQNNIEDRSGSVSISEPRTESLCLALECERTVLQDDHEDESEIIIIAEPVKASISQAPECEKLINQNNLAEESETIKISNSVQQSLSLALECERTVQLNVLEGKSESVNINESVEKCMSVASECERTILKNDLQHNSEPVTSESESVTDQTNLKMTSETLNITKSSSFESSAGKDNVTISSDALNITVSSDFENVTDENELEGIPEAVKVLEPMKDSVTGVSDSLILSHDDEEDESEDCIVSDMIEMQHEACKTLENGNLSENVTDIATPAAVETFEMKTDLNQERFLDVEHSQAVKDTLESIIINIETQLTCMEVTNNVAPSSELVKPLVDSAEPSVYTKSSCELNQVNNDDEIHEIPCKELQDKALTSKLEVSHDMSDEHSSDVKLASHSYLINEERSLPCFKSPVASQNKNLSDNVSKQFNSSESCPKEEETQKTNMDCILTVNNKVVESNSCSVINDSIRINPSNANIIGEKKTNVGSEPLKEGCENHDDIKSKQKEENNLVKHSSDIPKSPYISFLHFKKKEEKFQHSLDVCSSNRNFAQIESASTTVLNLPSSESDVKEKDEIQKHVTCSDRNVAEEETSLSVINDDTLVQLSDVLEDQDRTIPDNLISDNKAEEHCQVDLKQTGLPCEDGEQKTGDLDVQVKTNICVKDHSPCSANIVNNKTDVGCLKEPSSMEDIEMNISSTEMYENVGNQNVPLDLSSESFPVNAECDTHNGDRKFMSEAKDEIIVPCTSKVSPNSLCLNSGSQIEATVPCSLELLPNEEKMPQLEISSNITQIDMDCLEMPCLEPVSESETVDAEVNAAGNNSEAMLAIAEPEHTFVEKDSLLIVKPEVCNIPVVKEPGQCLHAESNVENISHLTSPRSSKLRQSQVSPIGSDSEIVKDLISETQNIDLVIGDETCNHDLDDSNSVESCDTIPFETTVDQTQTETISNILEEESDNEIKIGVSEHCSETSPTSGTEERRMGSDIGSALNASESAVHNWIQQQVELENKPNDVSADTPTLNHSKSSEVPPPNSQGLIGTDIPVTTNSECIAGSNDMLNETNVETTTEEPSLWPVILEPEIPFFEGSSEIMPVESVLNWPYLEEEVISEFPISDSEYHLTCPQNSSCNKSSVNTDRGYDGESESIASPDTVTIVLPENNRSSDPSNDNTNSAGIALNTSELKCRLSWKRIFDLAKLEEHKKHKPNERKQRKEASRRWPYYGKIPCKRKQIQNNESSYKKVSKISGPNSPRRRRRKGASKRLELGPAKIEVRLALKPFSKDRLAKTWQVVDVPNGDKISVWSSSKENNNNYMVSSKDISSGEVNQVPIVLVKRLILKRRLDDSTSSATEESTPESGSPNTECSSLNFEEVNSDNSHNRDLAVDNITVSDTAIAPTGTGGEEECRTVAQDPINDLVSDFSNSEITNQPDKESYENQDNLPLLSSTTCPQSPHSSGNESCASFTSHSSGSKRKRKRQLPRVIIKRTGAGTAKYRSFLRISGVDKQHWQPVIRLERSSVLDSLARNLVKNCNVTKPLRINISFREKVGSTFSVGHKKSLTNNVNQAQIHEVTRLESDLQNSDISEDPATSSKVCKYIVVEKFTKDTKITFQREKRDVEKEVDVNVLKEKSKCAKEKRLDKDNKVQSTVIVEDNGEKLIDRNHTCLEYDTKDSSGTSEVNTFSARKKSLIEIRRHSEDIGKKQALRHFQEKRAKSMCLDQTNAEQQVFVKPQILEMSEESKINSQVSESQNTTDSSKAYKRCSSSKKDNSLLNKKQRKCVELTTGKVQPLDNSVETTLVTTGRKRMLEESQNSECPVTMNIDKSKNVCVSTSEEFNELKKRCLYLPEKDCREILRPEAVVNLLLNKNVLPVERKDTVKQSSGRVLVSGKVGRRSGTREQGVADNCVSEEGSSSCRACGWIFGDKEERTAHIRRHPYHCQRCHLAFKSEVDFVSHLSSKHPSTREQHHCLLCEISFPTTAKHQLHVSGRMHRQLEAIQRRTIHTVFTLLTGSNCPGITPLTESEVAGLKWFPSQPGAVHFYHQATPLQMAIQDWMSRHQDTCSTTQIEPSEDTDGLPP